MKYKAGDTIRFHPCTNWFMMGATHGEVVKVGYKWIHVLLLRGLRPAMPRTIVKVPKSSKNICHINGEFE